MYKKNSDAFKDFFYICYKGPPHLNIAFRHRKLKDGDTLMTGNVAAPLMYQNGFYTILNKCSFKLQTELCLLLLCCLLIGCTANESPSLWHAFPSRRGTWPPHYENSSRQLIRGNGWARWILASRLPHMGPAWPAAFVTSKVMEQLMRHDHSRVLRVLLPNGVKRIIPPAVKSHYILTKRPVVRLTATMKRYCESDGEILSV